MNTTQLRFSICFVILLLALACGGISFYQLAHIIPRQVTHLALGSAFLISDTAKLSSWGGYFALIYISFHALLFCASSASILILASSLVGWTASFCCPPFVWFGPLNWWTLAASPLGSTLRHLGVSGAQTPPSKRPSLLHPRCFCGA